MVNMNLKFLKMSTFKSTLRCILHHRNDFTFEYLHEFSAKNKIVTWGSSKGTRRSYLMQKTNTQKSRVTFPLKGDLLIDATFKPPSISLDSPLNSNFLPPVRPGVVFGLANQILLQNSRDNVP